MTGFLQEESSTVNSEDRQVIDMYFGSVQNAVLYLFMSTTGGIDWHEMYEAAELGGTIVIIAYIFFIGFFGFAVMTILSGIFIEKALEAAAPGRENSALESRWRNEEQAEDL